MQGKRTIFISFCSFFVSFEMPNRSIVLTAAIGFIIILGLLLRSPGSSPKVNDDQDFSLVIPPTASSAPYGNAPPDILSDEQDVLLSQDEQRIALAEILDKQHITISSKKTTDKKFWSLDFGKVNATHPTILAHPHPIKTDYWIMLGLSKRDDTKFQKELICEASFKENTMACAEPPQLLPVSTIVSPLCEKQYDGHNYEIGPRHTRAFFGPTRPYFLYSAPSLHSCVGVWMQDLTRLYYWLYSESLEKSETFFEPTDLARPGPSRPIERNWFAFWDRNDEMHLHYNIYPKRSFAKLNSTGGVEQELAVYSEASDQACMQMNMPQIQYPAHEKIVQATNALSVTMCNRSDEACFESEQNTFIMTIFNVKTTHLVENYDPYVMLFKRTAPFEIHAIGKKPLWIDGRKKLGQVTTSNYTRPASSLIEVNSMAYIKRDRLFHGYMDDPMYLSFSIDNERGGAIDVTPADLLQELGTCI